MKIFWIISIVLIISCVQIVYAVENGSESSSISSASIEDSDLNKLREDRVTSDSSADISEINPLKQKRIRCNECINECLF